MPKICENLKISDVFGLMQKLSCWKLTEIETEYRTAPYNITDTLRERFFAFD